MGACYGKGSGPHDPDKAPYGREEKRRQKGTKKVIGERKNDGRTTEDQLKDNGQDVESPPTAIVTAVDSDGTTEIEPARIQLPRNKPEPETLYTAISAKTASKLDTGESYEKNISSLKPKEETSPQQRQQISLTPERNTPKLDVSAPVRVSGENITKTSSITTSEVNQRKIISDEDVAIEIIQQEEQHHQPQQPKLKSQSPWTVTSKSQSYSATYTQISTKVTPVTSSLCVTDAQKEDDKDNEQIRRSAFTPPLTGDKKQNEKNTVFNDQRIKVQEIEKKCQFNESYTIVGGQDQKKEIYKTGTDLKREIVKDVKNLSPKASTTLPVNVVEPAAVVQEKSIVEADDKRHSGISDNRSPTSVSTDANNVQKVEREQKTVIEDKTKQIAAQTKSSVITTVREERVRHDIVNNGIHSEDTKDESRGGDENDESAAKKSKNDGCKASTEGRKIEIPQQNAHSNIPSPTGLGSLRSQKKERTKSASSIKYTSTSSASNLRRASSGTDATTVADKPKEVQSRQSTSSVVTENDELRPTKTLSKEDIVSLLCDFTNETREVLTKYQFCPNTRSRLMNCIQKWIAGEETEKVNLKRVWLITGTAGVGKSAMAAEVYRKQKSNLVVAHFFKYNHPNMDYNDAWFVLQSLACQLCAVIPTYLDVLSRSAELDDMLKAGDLNKAFDSLISRPLRSNELNRDTTDRVLIVLDAVDECSPSSRQQLLKIINSFAETTPDWICLIVTSRNENQILSQLENVRTLEIKQTSDSLSDIKRFLKQPMGRHMDRISLDGGLTQLVKKTDGNFLCARVLGEMVDQLPEEKTIALRDVDTMFPKGISNCYNSVFRAFRENLGKLVSPNELNDKYQSVVGLLCSALEPIPIDMLVEIVKVDKECLDSLRPVLDIDSGCFSLHNRHTAEWLDNDNEAGDLQVNSALSQKRLANWCLLILNYIRNRSESKYSTGLRHYALKHVVWHLLDVPKQQDNIAALLCELRYISDKLQVPGIQVRHLLHDYEHRHYTSSNKSRQVISMTEYMKKHPKLLQQMAIYQQFVRSQSKNLDENPNFALHIAANYPNSERIQQNALVELEGKPWLEDRTRLAETHHVNIPLETPIEDADLSSDGKTLALITSDENTNLLMLLHSSSGEKKTASVDIKALNDKLGSCVRFLADDSAVFVGSLTMFINPRQGATMSSGIDVKSIQMKEKYVIESCDVSKKFLVCGLSTLPTGGRSLHLALIDLKAKKCTRNIEVLKFRFGGSTQFGIKCCALSRDDSLICSLVKESHKTQFVCTLWSTAKGTSLNKVNVSGESLTKCLFVSNDTIIIGSGLRSCVRSDRVWPMERTKLWDVKAGQQVRDWDGNELGSVFSAYGSGYISLKWYAQGSRAYLDTWKGKDVSAEAAVRYRIDGVSDICEVMATADRVIVFTRDNIRLYNICDLTEIPREENNTITGTDVQVTNLSLHPRREELAICHVSPGQQDNNICSLDLLSDEILLSPSPVKQFTANARKHQNAVFHGKVTKRDICQHNSDGSLVVVNAGKSVVVWDTANNTSTILLSNDNSQDDSRLECVTSQKDNIVGVLHPNKPGNIQVFDLKSRHMIRQFSLPNSDAVPTDFLFMPYNGYLVAYYKDSDNILAIWNPRNGELVHLQNQVDIAYLRLSPASDRLAISINKQSEGSLLLRSSDSKISIKLNTPRPWTRHPGSSDVEFVTDGTVLVGVMETNTCLIWNAANGDVLREWKIDFRGPIEVVGTITNSHVLLHDSRLMVVDLVSGQIVTSMSLVENLVRKTDPLGAKISPKCNTIVGSTKHGHLKLLECHNYGAIKRKTTLQILKSTNK